MLIRLACTCTKNTPAEVALSSMKTNDTFKIVYFSYPAVLYNLLKKIIIIIIIKNLKNC